MLLLLLFLMILLLFLRMLPEILPVLMIVVVIVATSTSLVASTWEVSPSSTPEVIWPTEAAVIAPEVPVVLVTSRIFLLPVIGWRIRS